ETDKAMEVAQALLKVSPKDLKALWVEGEVLSARGDAPGAKAAFEALIAAGGDGYEPRMRLARLAKDRGDFKELEEQLKRAMALDPERSEPDSLLADLYFKNNRENEGVVALKRYVMIEQMEYAPQKKLVEKYAARKAWAEVRQAGEMALFVNPFDAELHVT